MEQNENGAADEWARAREILDDMRKKRTSLASAGHSSSQGEVVVHPENDHPSSPTVSTKLGTVHEYDNTETDRAREILEQMKKRRENFSQLLVGVSPTPTKQSLTETESTAELSWVSSFSEDEADAYIYSEEEASNSYDDYAYRSGVSAVDVSDDDSSSSHYSSSSSSSRSISIYSGGTSSYTSSLITNSSFQKSILQALEDIRSYDLRYVNIPNPLTAASSSRKVPPSDQSLVLKRKTPQTSRARNLYRQSSNGSVQSYSYLKTERTGPGAVTRLRADLAAISERRNLLASIIESVQHLKSDEIDFSVVASAILSNDSKVKAGKRPAAGKALARYEMAGPGYVPPCETSTEPIEFDGKWSAKDARPEDHIESFGFPLVELKWGSESNITAISFDSNGDNVEWDKGDELEELVRDDSLRGSMYFSDSSTTEASEDRLPLHIEFAVKNAPLATVVAEPPRALRSAEYLKALYNPRPDEVNPTPTERKFGGIYHIAQLTAEVEQLTDRTHARRRHLARDDFDIPYNVEDRFCGGLYHIASQTRPASKRALI